MPLPKSISRPPGRIAPHLRWMIRSDLASILPTEQESYREPWGEDTFRRYLQRREVIGLVCTMNSDRTPTQGSPVIGYCVYRLLPKQLVILNLTVAEWHRRDGIGTLFIDKLKGKLSAFRHAKIAMRVSEYNLGGQLFLKAQGFAATTQLEYYSGSDEYLFEYMLPCNK